MYKVFFLAISIFLGNFQFLQSQCLFCECRHEYNVDTKKPVFNGTKNLPGYEWTKQQMQGNNNSTSWPTYIVGAATVGGLAYYGYTKWSRDKKSD